MGRPATTWKNVEQLIKRKVIIDATTNCWLWQGEIGESGYGRLRMGYAKLPVHRIIAILHLGLIDGDVDTLALHNLECPHKHCCNPDHLHLGNAKDNWKDRKAMNKGDE